MRLDPDAATHDLFITLGESILKYWWRMKL